MPHARMRIQSDVLRVGLHTLGFIWQLPAFIIIWLFYVLPAWGLGLIHYHSMPAWLVFRFTVHEPRQYELGLKLRYWRAWEGWHGWAGPSVMVLHPRAQVTTYVHELRHVHQNFVFGTFKYPCYGFASLVAKKKYGVWYRMNIFEQDARKYAAAWASNFNRANSRWPSWSDMKM